MADKGEYRGFYVALPDSPEFQALSPEARAIFYPLKLKLGKAGIDVFYPEVLPRLTGYPFERVSEGLQELQDTGWLIVEHNVYWIRNGLRFDPSEPLASPNQKKGIEAHIRTLPKLPIVNEFARYYELPEPHPGVEPFRKGSERVSKPLRSTEDGRRKTEDGNGSTTGAAAPGNSRNGQGALSEAQRLTNLVIDRGLNGVRPSDYGKQAAHAKKLLEKQPLDYWTGAAEKMGDLYPYTEGEAWDVFDLGKKATKALASSRNGSVATDDDDCYWDDPDGTI